MTTALLAATLFAGQAATAAEFFPLKAGVRLVYAEKSLQTAETTDRVGEPVEIAGVMTTPVETFQNGLLVNRTYYRVNAAGVDIIATSKEAPLPQPVPILRLPVDKKATWSFFGPLNADKQAEPVQMSGESQLKGEREVLGQRVPVLEVRTKAAVGGGRAQEESEQIALYGKGIGLIELTSITKIGKRKATSTLKLLRIETAKEGG